MVTSTIGFALDARTSATALVPVSGDCTWLLLPLLVRPRRRVDVHRGGALRFGCGWRIQGWAVER